MISERRLLEIYRLHKKELFHYIFRMISSAETAEDVLHDCFERLIQYSQRYDLEDVNLRSFLYKTAHNLAVNHLQKENRYQRVEFDDAVAPGRPDETAARLELDELNREIYRFLGQSDPVARSIFIMRKEQGMQVGAIAESLGISEKTVRRKINGLLERMYEQLKKMGLLNIFLVL
ncbi:MAG: sigma-70 family RNA polymerase sigma factor [Spirochaetes bacterium]|nr:sigma-70 family RNA polymerase sigma factor [Spirochaetota bacterium]